MFDKHSINLERAIRVYTHEDYIILQGTDFWVCKLDGTTVLRYHNMPNVHKVSFLPQNQLLICGGTNTSYRLLCLQTGAEIWRIPIIRKSYVSGRHFALSYDGMYAYDYYNYKDDYYIVQINLQTGEMRSCKVGMGFRALTDIICAENSDSLFLLRTQIDDVDGRSIGLNEIQRFEFPSLCYCETICRWESDGNGNSLAAFFLGDCRSVISEDLHVFESDTGKTYSLVENDPDWIKPGFGPNDCWVDASNRYICLSYDNVNVVLDRKKQKMVARYAASFARGCLIGDTYWIPSTDKVEKKPFPIVEDIPKRKLKVWRV